MTLDTASNTSSNSTTSQADPLMPVTARGQATRRKLLNAAEMEFGNKGFHVSSVSSITGRAGVGQGTFYLYFRTKEEIFVTLVQEIGRNLRGKMQAALQAPGERSSRERAALQTFFDFSVSNRAHFRIVQEAQFVDEAVFRDYYEQIAADYAQSLEDNSEGQSAAERDPQVRAWGLLGMGHFVGLRRYLCTASDPSRQDFDSMMSLIKHQAPSQSAQGVAAPV